MVIMAVLVAALLQFFLPNVRLSFNQWIQAYLRKVMQLVADPGQNNWLTLAFLCLPAWILALLVLAILDAVLGPLAYWVLVSFVCWVTLDMYPASKGQSPISEWWLLAKRDTVFSPIFWFAIFKAPFLLLYFILRIVRDNWGTLVVKDGQVVPNVAADVLAYLAWIPTRLMVVAAAVVGDFVSTVKAASGFWLSGVRASDSQLWGCLQASLRRKSIDSDTESPSETEIFSQYRAMLVVWLIVLAIFTLGYLGGL